ncbi:MAG: hypothetical protein CVT66_01225 [Actinobacteria bacterium HGW-Actinobacteria-6]|jgi:FdhE protein|nr:MAG: hypothetical protein CVT66_01225 [Actinobacteria bacterium HGW-Actinobacteria-6]
MDLVNKVTSAYLETAGGSDAARLQFLKGLWEIQAGAAAVIRPYHAPAADAAREALVAGRPIFSVSAPEMSVAEYVDVAVQIAHYVSDAAGLSAEQSSALLDADLAGVINADLLARAVLSPEAFVAEVANGMNLTPETALAPVTIAFVLVSALVPFLVGPSGAALEAAEFDFRAWGSGRCPVCGADASMGMMGESSQLQGAERRLWCGHCHAEWSYERLRCVRCGTRNPDVLRYTYVEGDSAHRLHLCEECHGYAKFTFIDDLGKPVSMVVEDAVTAVLEAVAADQGYTATGDGGKSSC